MRAVCRVLGPESTRIDSRKKTEANVLTKRLGAGFSGERAGHLSASRAVDTVLLDRVGLVHTCQFFCGSFSGVVRVKGFPIDDAACPENVKVHPLAGGSGPGLPYQRFQ